jgi:AraC-like DNA-binding protein
LHSHFFVSYVALTRASTVSPIVEFMKQSGARVDRTLDYAGLPSSAIVDREALIPSISSGRLLHVLAREFAIPDVGLAIGLRSPVESLGVFGRLIRAAPTVGHALEAAVRYGSRLSSSGNMRIVPRGDHVEFLRCSTLHRDPRDAAAQQGSLFCLGLLIAIVRLGAGPEWFPSEAHLQTVERPEIRASRALARTRLAFRQSATMITVPQNLLAAPVAPAPRMVEIAPDVIARWTSSAPRRDFVGSIGQAIDTLSADHYPTVRETADFVRLSVRTLQRRLAAARLSHEALVADVRFATAARVLVETNAKVLDVALDLGYSDHANFTRAFRRWARCSPQEYRTRNRQARFFLQNAACGLMEEASDQFADPH